MKSGALRCHCVRAYVLVMSQNGDRPGRRAICLSEKHQRHCMDIVIFFQTKRIKFVLAVKRKMLEPLIRRAVPASEMLAC